MKKCEFPGCGKRHVPFLGHVDKNGPNGCWIWTGPRRDRYGKYRQDKAHRISWAMHRGPVPAGMHVLHRCDVGLCVNPDHLFLGTHGDNMRDKVAKGRQPHGERHYFAKLTEADVIEIRRRLAAGEEQLSIARDFHVHGSGINRIGSGKLWRVRH